MEVFIISSQENHRFVSAGYKSTNVMHLTSFAEMNNWFDHDVDVTTFCGQSLRPRFASTMAVVAETCEECARYDQLHRVDVPHLR